MKTLDIAKPITAKSLNENLYKQYNVKINFDKYSREQLEDARNKYRSKLFAQESQANFNDLLHNESYQRDKFVLDVLNTRIKEMLGESIASKIAIMEKAVIKKKQSLKKNKMDESWDDDDDDVRRADAELKRLKKKPIKAANIDPDKDKIKRTRRDREEEDELDEGYDSREAYDKWDPKHPDFVKNFKKFKANNPDGTTAQYIAHLKKQPSKMDESWDDDDDDVRRADAELKRLKKKPIKAANIDPDKDKIKRTKRDREEENDELDEGWKDVAKGAGRGLAAAAIIGGASSIGNHFDKTHPGQQFNANNTRYTISHNPQDAQGRDAQKTIINGKPYLVWRWKGRDFAYALPEKNSYEESLEQKFNKEREVQYFKHANEEVDEGYDSREAYDKWDPKHPDFVKNFKKFKANNPDGTTAQYIAHLKKQPSKIDESYDELMYKAYRQFIAEGIAYFIAEDEEGKAKSITAAADMVNDFTSWMQRVGNYQTKSMIELADNIRANFGLQEANAFKQSVGAALEGALTALTQAREEINNAVAVLAGEAPAEEQMGMDSMGATDSDNGMNASAPDNMNMSNDEFAASDAAAGGPETTGRLRRESIDRGNRLMKILGA